MILPRFVLFNFTYTSLPDVCFTWQSYSGKRSCKAPNQLVLCFSASKNILTWALDISTKIGLDGVILSGNRVHKKYQSMNKILILARMMQRMSKDFLNNLFTEKQGRHATSKNLLIRIWSMMSPARAWFIIPLSQLFSETLCELYSLFLKSSTWRWLSLTISISNIKCFVPYLLKDLQGLELCCLSLLIMVDIGLKYFWRYRYSMFIVSKALTLVKGHSKDKQLCCKQHSVHQI